MTRMPDAITILPSGGISKGVHPHQSGVVSIPRRPDKWSHDGTLQCAHSPRVERSGPGLPANTQELCGVDEHVQLASAKPLAGPLSHGGCWCMPFRSMTRRLPPSPVHGVRWCIVLVPTSCLPVEGCGWKLFWMRGSPCTWALTVGLAVPISTYGLKQSPPRPCMRAGSMREKSTPCCLHQIQNLGDFIAKKAILSDLTWFP